jgi:ABC-type multidrug transport system ATPase subunit
MCFQPAVHFRSQPHHVIQGRLTLLLGPPSCGKTTFLKALAGRLPEEQYTGTIQYNGHSFADFVPERTVVFVAQDDTHVPNLTARETVKFAYDIQQNPESATLCPPTTTPHYAHATSHVHWMCIQ